MRSAVVVGIDHYDSLNRLYGCVNDAKLVSETLARHGDTEKSINFEVELLVSKPDEKITRHQLKDAIKELFEADLEIALLYFAGHGHVEAVGGYLATSEVRRGDEGVSLAEILTMANTSKSKNKVIALDSCHSGVAGTKPIGAVPISELAEGVTILTASTATQYATEQQGHGVFTNLFVNALQGAAANLVGDVTPGSVYAHIDQSLGFKAQRPVFKTNVKSFVSLRRVQPAISLGELRRIAEFFPEPNSIFKLDPTFEPNLVGRSEGMPAPDVANTERFAVLQKYNRVGLLVPVGAPHMWHAAMTSTGCKLTPLGEHYRRLILSNRL